MRILARLSRFGIVLVASAAACAIASASVKDVYIAQIAAGTADGSSCSNARVYTFFNSAANWGGGTTQVGSGTTVHLCGTFTGVGNAPPILSTQGSGVAGNPITIRFETGAMLTAPSWNWQGAIAIGHEYITLDGGGTGIIEDTMSGTPGGACPGGTCAYTSDSRGVRINSSGNVTVQNLTVRNLYVRTSTTDTAPDGFGYPAVFAVGPVSNITVQGCTFHDTYSGTDLWGNNITVANNVMYHVEHGVTFGVNTSVSGLYIYGNHYYDPYVWDDAVYNNYHHDGIHLWTSGADVISNVYIYNNLFDGNLGSHMTADIYMENMDASGPIYVFNNVFRQSSTATTANGLLSAAAGRGLYVFNNTLVGSGNGKQGMCVNVSGSLASFQNNVVLGCTTMVNTNNGTTFATGGLKNNVYASGGSTLFNYGGSTYSTLAAWQSGTGQDNASSYYSTTAAVKLDSDGSLQAGSPAIGMAINLSTSCSGPLAPLCQDTTDGNTRIATARPSTGAWDAGAFLYPVLVPGSIISISTR